MTVLGVPLSPRRRAALEDEAPSAFGIAARAVNVRRIIYLGGLGGLGAGILQRIAAAAVGSGG